MHVLRFKHQAAVDTIFYVCLWHHHHHSLFADPFVAQFYTAFAKKKIVETTMGDLFETVAVIVEKSIAVPKYLGYNVFDKIV